MRDGNRDTGEIRCELHLYQTGVVERPAFRLTPVDGGYRLYRDALERLWADSETDDQDGDLTIHSAKFGVGDVWEDVTEILRSSISEGNLSIQVTIEVLGDPVPGECKLLRVAYSYAGKRDTKVEHENAWLYLP
jgi:hypothetical protein